MKRFVVYQVTVGSIFHAQKDQFSKLLDRIRNTEIQLDTFERANQKQEATIVKLRKTNRQLEWDIEREKLQENCSTRQKFIINL